MEKQNKEQSLLSEWRSKGLAEPSISQKGFDSNVITPGTVFMHKLSKALEVIIFSYNFSFTSLTGCNMIICGKD